MADMEYELEDEGKSYIPIDETMRLAISPRNWQLQKLHKSKKGEDTWSAFRYYVSLNNALKDILHIKLAKESFNSANTFLEASNKVINEISSKFSTEYEIRKV